MLTDNQKKQALAGFKAAREIALTIPAGHYRRARVDDVPANYIGYKERDGRMWVIGDTAADLQNPDAKIEISGEFFPAREIFGNEWL